MQVQLKDCIQGKCKERAKIYKKKVCNGGGCINLTIDSLANAIASLNEDCLSPKGFSTHS
jgi:hypothetical protein